MRPRSSETIPPSFTEETAKMILEGFSTKDKLKMLRDQLWRAGLTYQEGLVLQLRYGIDLITGLKIQGVGSDLEKTAKFFYVGRSLIRQIENAALNKLTSWALALLRDFKDRKEAG